MPVILNGYSNTNFVKDCVLGPAIIRIGSTNIGVTKGAPKFDPGWTLENPSFDGKDAPLYLLDRKFYGEAVMSFTLIEFGPAASGNQIAKLEAGSTAVDAGTTPNTKTTITPKAGRNFYVAADYLTDTYMISMYPLATGAGIKTYPSIHFAKGLVRKWDWSSADKAEDMFSVEIAARKDGSSGTLADAPYDIVLWETLP